LPFNHLLSGNANLASVILPVLGPPARLPPSQRKFSRKIPPLGLTAPSRADGIGRINQPTHQNNATTIDEVAGFLTSAGMKFAKLPDRPVIVTGFATEHYRDSDGDSGIRIVIALEEDGEFIKIMAPSLYTYKDGPNKAALFQTLLQVSWMTKMVQFEYDPDDGEVRMIIEFPLEDSTLTERQLMRAVMGLAQLADEYHEQIVAAMEQGIVPEGRDELMAAFEEFMRQRRERQTGLELDE
jgi:hypothetical protein